MKTLKSLHALVALCCLTLFVTSCQDDFEKNSVQPTAEPPVVSEMQQMLESVADQPAPDFSNARLAGSVPVSYALSVTTSAFDFATGQAGEVLRTFEGTLELTPVDKIPGLNVVITDQDFQLYAGEYTFENARGRTSVRRAAAVVLEDGTSYLLVRNLPNTGNVFTEAFVLAGDFSVTGLLSVNQQSELVSVTLDGDFAEQETLNPIAALEAATSLGKAFIGDITVEEAVQQARENTQDQAVLNILDQVESGALTVAEGINALTDGLNLDNLIIVDNAGETVVIPLPVGTETPTEGPLNPIAALEAATSLGKAFIGDITVEEAVQQARENTQDQAVLSILDQVGNGTLTVAEGINTLTEGLNLDNLVVTDSQGETVVIPLPIV